jgi:hypothetical protein
MRVTEREEVLGPDNFGKIRFSDFDIYTFEEYNIDADTVDDRFIPYNFFKRQNLTLPAVDNQLDSITALKALFPGRFFKDFEYSENANVIFWICDACPEVKLATNYFSIDGKPEMYEFPDGFANFTHVIGTLTYIEKNTLHKAIFFSTAADYPGSGRFSGGILGIAIFKKNASGWSLTAFSPHVATEGSFSTAHTPQKVIHAGNHTFFELAGGNANGAGASYLYREKFIFGLNANVPTLLFHDADGACESYDNRMTHWATNVLSDSNLLPFPDLSLITTGFYSKDGEEQQFWDNNSWLKKLQKHHPRQDSFDFKVTRQCRFNGREYKMISIILE